MPLSTTIQCKLRECKFSAFSHQWLEETDCEHRLQLVTTTKCVSVGFALVSTRQTPKAQGAKVTSGPTPVQVGVLATSPQPHHAAFVYCNARAAPVHAHKGMHGIQLKWFGKRMKNKCIASSLKISLQVAPHSKLPHILHTASHIMLNLLYIRII